MLLYNRDKVKYFYYLNWNLIIMNLFEIQCDTNLQYSVLPLNDQPLKVYPALVAFLK